MRQTMQWLAAMWMFGVSPLCAESAAQAVLDLRSDDKASGPVIVVRSAAQAREDQKPRTEKATYLGVVVDPADATLRKHLKLIGETGLVVGFVEADSPAARAGLQVQDVLTMLNDQILVNGDQLRVLTKMHKPGQKVELSFVREGTPMKVPVELAEKEIKTATVESQARAAYNSAMAVMQPGLTISRTVERDRAGKASRTSITVVRGEHSLQYLIADGEEHLTVTDARTGKTVFSGPVTTEEQREALPPEIRGKLKEIRMWRTRPELLMIMTRGHKSAEEPTPEKNEGKPEDSAAQEKNTEKQQENERQQGDEKSQE